MRHLYGLATNRINTRWLGGLQAAFIVRSLNIQAALRRCPPAEGSRILDAGCGEGASLAAVLARRYPSVQFIAVDLCLLTPPNPCPPGLDLYEADILHAPFDGPFDAVYSLDLLEHVEDPGAVLRKFYQWMCPGGRLYLHIPAAAQFHFLKEDRKGRGPALREIRKGDLHLREGFSPEELRTLLSNAGFGEIGLRYTFSRGVWFVKELYALGERHRIPGIGLLLMPLIVAGTSWDRVFPPRKGNGLWAEARKPSRSH